MQAQLLMYLFTNIATTRFTLHPIRHNVLDKLSPHLQNLDPSQPLFEDSLMMWQIILIDGIWGNT